MHARAKQRRRAFMKQNHPASERYCSTGWLHCISVNSSPKGTLMRKRTLAANVPGHFSSCCNLWRPAHQLERVPGALSKLQCHTMISKSHGAPRFSAGRDNPQRLSSQPGSRTESGRSWYGSPPSMDELGGGKGEGVQALSRKIQL